MKQRGSAPLAGMPSDLDIEQLESLVDELIKQKPQEDRIRTYMRQAGLDYSADPIEQLSSVLQALEGNSQTKKAGKTGGRSV